MGFSVKRVKDVGGPVLIDEVEVEMFNHMPEEICNIGDNLLLLPADETHRRYIDFIAASLAPFLPATALVELGAGYGSILLALAKRDLFSGIPLLAGDFSPSGVELIKRFSAAQDLEIQTAHCDFNAQPMTTLPIPPGAIIYTVYGLSCIPVVSAGIIRAFASYSPSIVVNFEPCLEYCDSNTLLGLMRRRYIEINGYNKNLATVLHQEQEVGNIQILEERPSEFGKNPFFSCSVVTWKPVLSTRL